MNTVLNWPDRVLVISQGDDATRWYYYRYELTAQVVNGFGAVSYTHLFDGRKGRRHQRPPVRVVCVCRGSALVPALLCGAGVYDL